MHPHLVEAKENLVAASKDMLDLGDTADIADLEDAGLAVEDAAAHHRAMLSLPNVMAEDEGKERAAAARRAWLLGNARR